MLFELVCQKVKREENGEVKCYSNFYLKGENGIKLPIYIKVFKDKEGNIKNPYDFLLASKLATEIIGD